MISGEFSLFLRNDAALFGRTGHHFRHRLFQLFHHDRLSVSARREKRRLIEHVFQIRRRKSRRHLCQNTEIYRLIHRFILGVDAQDRLSASDIGQTDNDLTVESSRSQKRRVQYIRTVGRRKDDYAFIQSESIHLHQHLIERLLSFVMAAAQTCASASAHRVDFIDKDNARRIFLRLFEQISHSGSADTDEHLHEIRTGNAEERYSGLSRHRFCNEGFTCSRRAYQKHALWYSRAQSRIFLRTTQKIHDFLQLLFFFFQTGDVAERDLFSVALVHSGAALAERHRLARSSLAGIHEDHPDDDEYDDRQQIRQHADIPRSRLRRFAGDHQLAVIHLRHHQIIIYHHQLQTGRRIGMDDISIFQGTLHIRLLQRQFLYIFISELRYKL